MIVSEHAGQVPSREDHLRSLPGVGEYTAAAVAAFAFGQRTVVLDVNVRRVISRIWKAEPAAPGHVTISERAHADQIVPLGATKSVQWNVAAMEFGALVCTAQNPRCDECPITDVCAWRARGYPGRGQATSRPQGFEGTDRQVRGRILAILREHTVPVQVSGRAELADIEPGQLDRCLLSLTTDGLAHEVEVGAGMWELS